STKWCRWYMPPIPGPGPRWNRSSAQTPLIICTRYTPGWSQKNNGTPVPGPNATPYGKTPSYRIIRALSLPLNPTSLLSDAPDTDIGNAFCGQFAGCVA